jgi:hypothetical protein
MSDKRNEKQNEMGERLAGRFGDDPDIQGNPDNLDKPDNTEQQTSPDNSDEQTEIDPKEDWTGRMVYVPDGGDCVENLLDTFDGEYDRMQYETDWEVRKQRHYYPVLIQVGIDELQDMSGSEFTDAVENLGLR